MEILNLDPIVAVVITGMVAGVVELIKRAFKKDWKAVITILGAGITGALCIIPFGINPLFGTIIGLSASGYVTIAQNVGKEQL